MTIPQRFTPLQLGSVITLTILGVLGSTGLYRMVTTRSAEPTRTFRHIVAVALPVTFIPDAAIWATSAYGGAAKAETVLPLMLMHIAAATACWILLPSLTQTGPGDEPSAAA